MNRPTKEQVDACMAQVFAEVGELYKGPSAGQFILAAEVRALREELAAEQEANQVIWGCDVSAMRAKLARVEAIGPKWRTESQDPSLDPWTAADYDREVENALRDELVKDLHRDPEWTP